MWVRGPVGVVEEWVGLYRGEGVPEPGPYRGGREEKRDQNLVGVG